MLQRDGRDHESIGARTQYFQGVIYKGNGEDYCGKLIHCTEYCIQRSYTFVAGFQLRSTLIGQYAGCNQTIFYA